MALDKRSTINFLNVLVTCGVIILAVKLSDGSFATRINKISENLDKALAEVMNERRPNFTELSDNATYISDASFYPKGMAGLYNMTNFFVGLVLPKDIYPEGFIKIQNNRVIFGSFQEEWKGFLSKYAGLLTMIIILALLIVFMPLCGFCFCCCRCCGKCGARSQPFDKKHDMCKKFILATLLIMLGTALLFGVVCSFVTNQQMQEGVDDLTTNFRKGVKDVNTYLDTTKVQVNTLLDVNYDEFEIVLMETMNESNDIVYNNLATYSNATSMTELVNIVNRLPSIKEGFDTLKYSTNTLRVYASQLNDAVRKVKKDLLATLNNCTWKKCQEINRNISSLQTSIHFNSLPDISSQIQTLNDLDQSTFTNAVTEGKENLEKIRVQIGTTVNRTLEQVREKVHDAGRQIKTGSRDLNDAIDDIKRKINDNTDPALKQADTYIKQYGPYRYYVGLAISCVLLLISLCVALGLICGICGKRPDVYGDDCCNKGAGSQFLICGVMIMFLCGFVIAIVILVTFIVGVASQRIVCDPMRSPGDSQVFELINQLNMSEYHINFNISEALEKCYRNKTIYEVFSLKNEIDLDEVQHYLDKFNISSILERLDVASVNFDDDWHILSENDTRTLKNLSMSSFAIVSLDNFKELLEENFTTVNLTELSNEIGNLIMEIGDHDNGNIVTDLQLAKMNIETYQEKIVEPMIKNATAVVKLAIKLESDLKLDHGSFQKAIESMLQEVEAAETELKSKGTTMLKNIAVNFTNGIKNQIQTYLDRVVEKTHNEVGKCGPLSLFINSTLTSTCDKILLPWNGFWFGLFWSLILFIPTIMVSVKLATLYQKFSPYNGPLIESDYLYDAYTDRDNIPLNDNSRNGKNNNNKKKNKKYRKYEDRPAPQLTGPGAGAVIPPVGGAVIAGGPAGDMVTREYAGGSHHQDARYADMAPKHWEEFPAGGPPQYQRAPTEYERPPPYYYPGAVAENNQ